MKTVWYDARVQLLRVEHDEFDYTASISSFAYINRCMHRTLRTGKTNDSSTTVVFGGYLLCYLDKNMVFCPTQDATTQCSFPLEVAGLVRGGACLPELNLAHVLVQTMIHRGWERVISTHQFLFVGRRFVFFLRKTARFESRPCHRRQMLRGHPM